MTEEFAHLVRCLDVREKDVADAVLSREKTRALVLHLAGCSAPNTGVAKVLLVFARMATTACDWIDGDLLVELVGDDEVTVVEVLTELGGGLRERLFAPTAFRAPLAEFTRAIERVPHLVAPLASRSASVRRISLSASANVRRTSIPPPPIEIAAESLFARAPVLPRPDGERLALPVIEAGSTAEELPSIELDPAPAAASPPPPAAEPLMSDVDQGWDD